MASFSYIVKPHESMWDDVVFATAQKDPHYSAEYWMASGKFNNTSKPLAFVYRDGSKIFVNPIFVSPIPSLRGSFDAESISGYTGAVSSCFDDCFLGAAWNAYVEFAKREKIIAEFQRLNPILGNERCAHPRAVVKHDRDIVVVDLAEDPTVTYRKGVKSDLKIFSRYKGVSKQSKEIEAIASFALVYARRMEQLTAAKNMRFDQEYFHGILAHENSRLHVAMMDGAIVAGVVTMESDSTTYYHLSAHDDHYVMYRPIHHLLAQVITDARIAKKKKVVLGGGRTSKNDDSLLSFKSGFSKVRVPYKTALIVHDPVAYREACAACLSVSNDWVLPWRKPLASRIEVGA